MNREERRRQDKANRLGRNAPRTAQDQPTAAAQTVAHEETAASPWRKRLFRP